MKPILRFQGDYRFLSNFFPAKVFLDGVIYPSLEHAYQAAKTSDPKEREKIYLAPTAATAKRLGRQVTMVDDFDRTKVGLMKILLQRKFQDKTLASMLRETGDVDLVEGNNWHDNFWGQCFCSRVSCQTALAGNWLGKLLVDLREELKIEALR